MRIAVNGQAFFKDGGETRDFCPAKRSASDGVYATSVKTRHGGKCRRGIGMSFCPSCPRIR